MSIIEGARKTGVAELGLGELKTAVALYDFAVDGGAVGDIALRGQNIPSGAVVLDALLEVETALTSGGAATGAVKSEAAADIQSAAAVTGAPWSTLGFKRATFVATTAPIKTTAQRTVALTVATAALTAGKFKAYIFFREFAA